MEAGLSDCRGLIRKASLLSLCPESEDGISAVLRVFSGLSSLPLELKDVRLGRLFVLTIMRAIGSSTQSRQRVVPSGCSKVALAAGGWFRPTTQREGGELSPSKKCPPSLQEVF